MHDHATANHEDVDFHLTGSARLPLMGRKANYWTQPRSARKLAKVHAFGNIKSTREPTIDSSIHLDS